MTEIHIDLNEQQDVPRLERSHIIQQAALDGLLERIRSRMESIGKPRVHCEEILEADGTPLFLDRRHGTIMIQGGRGSGKTTFIRNAFRMIEQDPKYEDLKHKVARLGVVDPTLIERKENLFVILVNKMKLAVEAYRKTHVRDNHGSPSYQDWRKNLEDLAEGFTTLEGIGSDHPMQDGWDDPQHVLQEGLKKARAGVHLEQRLHHFIARSLDHMGKQVFLLALDDIDTDFTRGWPVLEMLRRYLTSPRLIIVMSGDMDLYAMLVRGRQWDQFSKQHLKQDRYNDQLEPINRMVGHLQGQYLLKLLRSENRIALRPLSKLDIGQFKVTPRWGDEKQTATAGGPLPLGTFLNTYIENGLLMGTAARRDVSDLLLRQPVRTLLQLLMLHDGSPEAAIDAEAMANVLTDVLLRYNISPDELRETSPEQMPALLARFLTENRMWEYAHSFYPDRENDDLGLTLLVLSTWATGIMAGRVSRALDYMIRICFSHAVLTARLPQLLVRKKNENRDEDGLLRFIRFAELDRTQSLSGVASRIAIAAISGDNVGQRLGVIQLNRIGKKKVSEILEQMYGVDKENMRNITQINLNDKSQSNIYLNKIRDYFNWTPYRKRHHLSNYYNTPDTLLNGISPSEPLALLAVAPIARSMLSSGARRSFISIHRVIALVARLEALRKTQLDAAKGASPDEVLRILRQESMIRAYPLPVWADQSGSGGSPQTDESDDLDGIDGSITENVGTDNRKNEGKNHALVIKIASWINEPDNSNVALPPYVLERIYSRFFFTLAAIDDRMQRKNYFAGQLLHRHIIAFLNAILVEELIHIDGSPTRENPVTSDTNFIRNLKILQRQSAISGKPSGTSTCAFFSRIVACPLWNLYLDPNSDMFKGEFDDVFPSSIKKNQKLYQLKFATPQINKELIRDNLEVPMFENLYSLYNSMPVIGVFVVKTKDSDKDEDDTEETAYSAPAASDPASSTTQTP